MKFVDQAEIWVKAGDGGRGCAAFNREKYRPKGGPAGGDGGKGGDVILRTNPNLHTLLDLKYLPRHEARNGEPGMGKQKNGKKGTDHTIEIPVGTVVKEKESGIIITDLTEPHVNYIIAEGGIGGLGNMHFATSTNQSPRYAQPGKPGQERTLLLELKLIADVGLLGFPNAGKSTLISTISAARPKIADYPFTTLVPNLGVVQIDSDASFVIADIPGLIPGAHQGKGLGDRFLRHVERVKTLVHLVCPDEDYPNPIDKLELINNEIKHYSHALWKKPQIIVLSKCDLPYVKDFEKQVAQYAQKLHFPFCPISAVSHDGLKQLTALIAEQLK